MKQSFEEAYVDRYGVPMQNEASADGLLDEEGEVEGITYIRTYTTGARPIIGLDRHGIASIGDHKAVQRMCSTIQSLSLNSNRLSSFTDIARLVSWAPLLQSLSLTANPLDHSTFPGGPYALMTRLTTLDLSEYRGPEVLWGLAAGCVELKELKMNRCGIHTTPELPDGAFQKLESISLSHNEIVSFDDIKTIGQLPAVTAVNLSGNPLTTIPPHEGDTWPVLDKIVLSGTDVALDQLANLTTYPITNLRFSIDLCPILDGFTTAEARSIIIAVTGVEALNGSKVTDGTRRAAIREFLRQCCIAEDTNCEAMTSLGLGRDHPVFIDSADEFPQYMPKRDSDAYLAEHGERPYNVGRQLAVPPGCVRIRMAFLTPVLDSVRRSVTSAMRRHNPYILDRPGSPRTHRGMNVLAAAWRMVPEASTVDRAESEANRVFGIRDVTLARLVDGEMVALDGLQSIVGLGLGDEEEIFVQYAGM